MRCEPVAAHGAFNVVQYLWLLGPCVVPVRLGFEGETVERRRHVALCSRVVIIAPGTTYVVALLENDEVVYPGLL